MKLKLKVLPLAVAGALNASIIATLSISSALAQQAPAKADEKLDKIEVTGSRIPSINIEGTSPVTVIDAATIKVDGLRSVENLLNNLPQVFADQGGNVSNGATGTATVNLRNLGTSRTLVLVNGRRLPAGSPRTFAADLNQIPAPLIKRVEILTGGAGAVYGSDAIAGVVNFIMNDKFEGVQVDANQSFYNHSQQNPKGIADVIGRRAATNPSQFAVPGDKSADGKIFDANLLMGANFANGKGNGTIFFNYKKEDALLQSERDFSSCAVGSGATAFVCGGSSTSFPGRFILASGASRTVANAAGNTRAFAAATDQFNFAPYNFFQRPQETYGFNAAANYDVATNAKLYSEFSFHDNRSVAQIAPSGLFGVTTTMFFENPLLSADWRRDLGLTRAGQSADLTILRRNIEGGGRQDDVRHTSFRTVVGVKGDFGAAWNYDAFMQTGKVIYQETYKNDFSITRGTRALDVVLDAAGNAVCRSALDGSDPLCAPYNIFRLGGVTPAALAYLQTPGFQKGTTEQTVQGASISGDLGSYGWKFPAAKSAVGVAFGVERRVEKLQLDTDTAFTTGDLAGQGGPTIGVGGKYAIKEVFGEFRAPLVEGRQFAHLLSVNGSVRHSEIDTGQKADSYGFGLEWAPVQSFRVRGSYQRAVRAANVLELFAAQGAGLFNMDEDPCGPARTASPVACARTGVTAAQYGTALLDSPAGQYNGLFGGNPRLSPEKSDSYTFGFVAEPMKDMSITVDFFDIKVKEVVGSRSPTETLDQCLSAGLFCDQIRRDSFGTLWLQPTAQITALTDNVGRLRTKGFDLGFNYAHKIQGYGSVAWSYVGTVLEKLEIEQVVGLGAIECQGKFGNAFCGTPSPKYRHKLRAAWSTPWNWDMAMTWRHIDKVANENGSTNISGAFSQFDYIDLAGSWNLTKKLTLRAGINNLFDKDPPLYEAGAPFGNGNTYPQVYDALGRRVFASATYKF